MSLLFEQRDELTALPEKVRYELYKKALKVAKDRLDQREDIGLCLILNDLADNKMSKYYFYPDMDVLFPEFGKMKPKKLYGCLWWPSNPQGNKARLRALEKCIELTKP